MVEDMTDSAIMAGGVPEGSVRPSLERLKTLDALPDLDSQLRELEELCNHSSRAEMICKWLLGKLKASPEFCDIPKVWNILSSALRLLPPSRAATVLSSLDFLVICKATLEYDRSSGSSNKILMLAPIMNALLEASSGPQGMQLKAMLSLQAAGAAALFDLWIRSIQTLVTLPSFEHDRGHNLIWPAIQIWTFRKRAHDENEVFARLCLPSTSRLYSGMKRYGRKTQLKRKRESEGGSQHDYVQALESLLARHVFVPARTAFFKARESAETSGRQLAGSQNPAYVVQSMLQSLREVTPKDTGAGEDETDQLPDLLEIALRCTSMKTPKQRMRERSWIDALFQALQDCNKISNSRNRVRQVLRDLLVTTNRQEAHLSKVVLESIIDEYSDLGSGKLVDWDLIANVLDLDSDIFLDDGRVATLLSDISIATASLSEVHIPINRDWRRLGQSSEVEASYGDLEHSEDDLASFLRTRIITPMIRAFADTRSLGKFISLWAEQLKSEEGVKTSVFLTALKAELTPLLEESLTQTQIVTLFDLYLTPIRRAADLVSSGTNTASQAELKTGIVILDAIISGVQNETLTEVLHDRFKWLLDSTMSLVSVESYNPELLASLHSGPTYSSLSKTSQTWSLMASAFELWFPSWAALQDSVEEIAEKGAEIVTSHAFATAVSEHSRLELSRDPIFVSQAAGRFVAAVSRHLHRYESSIYVSELPRVKCLETADKLNLWTLLQYPDLVALVESPYLNEQIFDLVYDSSPSTIDSLQAIAEIIFQRSPADAINRLVKTFVNFIRHNCRDVEEHDDRMSIVSSASEEVTSDGDRFVELREKVVLDVLARLSADSIPRPHRENIINFVSRRQQKSEGNEVTGLQASRLALLVHLMSLNNATCTLSTDPEEVWRLVQSVNPEPYHDVCIAGNAIEELTTLQINHWMKTQEQHRTHSTLVSLASLMKTRIEFICRRGHLDGSARTLWVLIPLILQLEVGAKDALKPQLVYRDSKLMETFLETCFRSITSALSKTDLSFSETQWLLPAMKFLLRTPDSLIWLCGIEVSAWSEVLMESLKNLEALHHLNAWDLERSRSANNLVFVSCFQLVCKYAATDRLDMILIQAIGISKERLTITAREDFAASFTQYVDKLPDQEVLLLFQVLLDKKFFHRLALVLVEKCASRLDKVTVEDIKAPLSTILSRLLTQAAETDDILFRKQAISCAAMILRKIPSGVSQYVVEMTLTVLQRLLENSSVAAMIYPEVCKVLSVFLLQYRSRLHGRFHLVIKIFQGLLSQLLEPSNISARSGRRSRSTGVKHAQVLSRLLSLFCEPPQFKRQSKSLELVDESRKEQAYVGKSVQYILHHYCSRVLVGKMGPGVREAIMPGLWSIIEAMEMGDAEGVKSLSAAMNNSERAVLRGVYDDWRRFGKWTGA